MLLLQFSTSHYCRKARLALGYKGINYQTENLTPGLHILRLKSLTGLTTLPVLLPQIVGQPQAIGDSTEIFKFLESYQPEPTLFLPNLEQQTQAAMLEDWLDESIGTATRFVYYQFRAGEGKDIDPSLFSQMVIKVVRQQYGINDTTVELAKKRLANALSLLSMYWQKGDYLVGSRLSIADIAAAALLSPLALIPDYRQAYPQIFARIINIHQLCGEPLPPGLEDVGAQGLRPIRS
ncbi:MULTISPECIES: glutathione S-transferase family protein [Nostocales]|uniref:Glutathione S-transferase n=1 Tax=Dolichospermum flos-aquae UHCC 0037 TaxID=2590026 RepID=A0ACC7S5R8_DOLFA|nr:MULTISPECIES: glutathione S-transferase [Nostocales]MCX5981121.1 glutathione S-transferase [Nostocales cyanobacterium LacPavin_0920_SED1_MAG_38_18]ALB42911.1 glutathione S-transferase [Anabaena sp. WA102]MBO1066283.1 glutathione S-transferase [Anabaena sp. 54]MTJ43709.1 glutathione S-transferase [Dolichospermum flos-aquae UHCC 0037]OBQ15042.1 MAG: glutathione S-transferase [Anabaena sp. AL93]